MAGKEGNPEKPQGVRTGEIVRNTGLIVLALSLVLVPEVWFAGAALAAGGEIFRRNRAKAAEPVVRRKAA